LLLCVLFKIQDEFRNADTVSLKVEIYLLDD
jgi:hypothetical protein